MKKTISRLLALCLTLALLCPVVWQRAEAAGASLSGAGTLRPGNSVTLTFSVEAAKAYAVQAELSYDSSKLALIGTEQLIGGAWSMDMNGNTVVLQDGKLNHAIVGSEAVFSVTFQVKSDVSAGSTVSAAVKNISVSDGNSDTSLGSASWSATIAAPLSSNAALSSLSCDDAALSPSFSAGTDYYTVTVPYAVTALTLHYRTDDDDADVSLSGNSLSVGENTVSVTVTAEDGTTRRYTIAATRQQAPDYVSGKNANLSALTASVGTLSPAFQSEVTDYVIYLPYESDTISLSGTAQDGKALRVDGVTDAKLTVGDNLLSVRCTAEDGTTVREYKVHAWRMPLYAGVLPTIVTQQEGEEQPVEQGVLGTLWSALCAAVTIPFISRYIGAVPLIAPVAAALLLVLVVLFLLGMSAGKSRGRRKALLEWNENLEEDADEEDGVYLEEDCVLPPRKPKEQALPEPATQSVEQPIEPETQTDSEPPSETEQVTVPAEEKTEQVAFRSPGKTIDELGGISLDELLKDIKNM